MDNTIILRLAAENEDMSDVDRLVNIYWAVSQALVFGVPGAIVEVGCNAGRTSVFLEMINDTLNGRRELHVYDSFEGLPEPGALDSYLRQGDCKATVDELRQTFTRWGVGPPIVHAGWFAETLPTGLPESICFAYLDGDFYDSIMTSLTYVWPRVSPNGLILIDDYGDKDRNPSAWEGLPGVRRAVDEYFAGRAEQPFVLCGTGDLSLAAVRKSTLQPA